MPTDRAAVQRAALAPHRWRVLAASLFLALAPGSAFAANRVLTIEIVGPEAAAYEGIKFEIRLADVTDPAVEPVVLGGTSTFSGDYELPQEMRIGFNDADLMAGRTYGIEVRVWQGSTLLYATLEPQAVDPLTTGTIDVRVDPPPPLALAGTRWVGEGFGGTILMPNGNPFRARLEFFSTDSTLSAQFDMTGPCGDWIGQGEFAGIRLAFTDVRYLSRQCGGDLALFTERLGAAIDATRTFAIATGALELRDAEGNLLARFTPFVLGE